MTIHDFSTLGVPAPLVAVLAAEGKTTPFPIQSATLRDTLAGRDVLGRGSTGSGKTLAFALPLVARLAGAARGRPSPARPRALVLAPTRELASQIEAVIAPLAAAYGMSTTTVFGGVPQNRQARVLQQGVDIVVACPGRLEDLMRQRLVRLDAVEVCVLDEADHMADLGFLPAVTRILEATPGDGQRMLFSATLDRGVDRLVRRFLRDEIRHQPDAESSPVAAMTHHVYEVGSPADKTLVLQALASGTGRRILFTRTKHQAKRLAAQLTMAGIPAVDLHGNLNQRQRDRNLAEFAGSGTRVLVATDVAARGVHVDGVELVVHVDPPAEHKAYLHRSGRTARAGEAGDVVTLMTPAQRRETELLLRKAAISATPRRVTPDSPEIAALVGEVAAFVRPSPRTPAPTGEREHAASRGRRGAAGHRRASGGGRPAGARRGRPAPAASAPR